jgi:TATA-binding protein-associated factor
MPNFLGSSVSFNKEFAKPIGKGQLPGASAECIHQSLEKLKLLHQQVLPFILRREKEHVLKELPPKCITNIPCRLSAEQHALYSKISELPVVKQSIQTLEQTLGDVDFAKTTAQISLGPATLKSLMLLRLLCTHPNLVKSTTLNGSRLEASGKFLALNDLLRSAGVYKDEITAADNDFSVLYCDNDDGASSDGFADVLTFDGDVCIAQEGSSLKPSKALIFAQFTKSLDAVEEYLFRPHMPSLRYLRLDGRVPAEERAKLADTFNRDDSIRAMLLTTKIGGLGLNLTGECKRKRVLLFFKNRQAYMLH